MRVAVGLLEALGGLNFEELGWRVEALYALGLEGAYEDVVGVDKFAEAHEAVLKVENERKVVK